MTVKAPATALTAPGYGRLIGVDMAQRTCSIEDCTRESRSRGWCQTHYMRFRRHGSVEDPKAHVDPGCSVEGCHRSHAGLGMCRMHYKRVWRKRNPTPRIRPTREEYFWSKVEKSEGCWRWMGQVSLNGYGRIGNDPAYRFAYELLVAQTPPGMWIDHRCHNPLCVNPAHLRVTTPKQNGENRAAATSASRSGIRGVSWDKTRNQWLVTVGHNRRNYNGGRFTKLADAERVAIELRTRLHTHNDVDRGREIR